MAHVRNRKIPDTRTNKVHEACWNFVPKRSIQEVRLVCWYC